MSVPPKFVIWEIVHHQRNENMIRMIHGRLRIFQKFYACTVKFLYRNSKDGAFSVSFAVTKFPIFIFTLSVFFKSSNQINLLSPSSCYGFMAPVVTWSSDTKKVKVTSWLTVYQFFLASSHLRLTTRFFQLNPYGNSPYVTSPLTRKWVCLLWICTVFCKVYVSHV
jgi:hypothetical protein